MKKIILCSTQRSGSTMICQDFRNTGVLGKPIEYFKPWNRSKKNIKDINWQKNLENILEQAKTENNVLSIKVMASQLRNINLRLLTFSGQIPGQEELFGAFYETFKDAFWIRIYRRDKVKQAISAVMAIKTGIYAMAEDGRQKDYNIKAVTSIAEIDDRIQKIKIHESIWDKFFDGNGISYHSLYYEDVCDSDYQYLYEIGDLVDIEIPTAIPPRGLVKLSNALNEEWEKMYREEKLKK